MSIQCVPGLRMFLRVQLGQYLGFDLLGDFFEGKNAIGFLLACGAAMTETESRNSIWTMMQRWLV